MGTRCDAMTFGALKHSRAGSLFGVLLEAKKRRKKIAGGALAERLESLTERQQGRIRRAADGRV